MMENLAHLGIQVTLIEMAPQVMGMFDYEMAQIIHQTIADNGVNLILNDGVKSFEQAGKPYSIIQRHCRGYRFNHFRYWG